MDWFAWVCVVAFHDQKAVFLYSKRIVNTLKCGIYIQITANMYKNIVFLYISKKRAYEQNTIT